LLGGWRRGYVINRLKKSNIPYTFLEKADLKTLRKMYNSCDLYVVGSRYEGGPQAIYEAAACKVPIVSSDVGTASQVLVDNCIIDIEKDLYYPTENDVNYNFINVQNFSIFNHAKVYEKMLRGYAK
jgi:glycosyltransferase involved in cell wall biosynthesis